MNNVHLLKRCLWTIFAAALLVYGCPNQSRAAAPSITPEELEYSGPFEMTGRIMDIDHGKNMLILAENKIYVVDLMVGAEHLMTMISDADGGALAFEALDRGQTVLVRGLQLPDGRVIAELIQLSSDQPPRGQLDSRWLALRQVRAIKPD